MFEDLVIFHTKGEQNLSSVDFTSSLNGVYWRTCIRQMVIGFTDDSTYAVGDGTYTLDNFSQDFNSSNSHGLSLEVYQGRQAYQFMVEVVSGLHSPIVGETEVHGQFRLFMEKTIGELAKNEIEKNDIAKNKIETPKNHHRYNLFFQKVFEDTKQVRSEFLRGGGSQSYGGVCRKHLKGVSSVGIIGGGHLSCEIIPWLLKAGKKVTVFCRRNKQGDDILRKFSSSQMGSLQVQLLNDSGKPTLYGPPAKNSTNKISSPESLIVAAPLTTQELEKKVLSHLPQLSHLKMIIDLRGDLPKEEALTLPLSKSPTIVDLSAVFEQMESTRQQMAETMVKAKRRVEELTEKTFETQQVRPFGWHEALSQSHVMTRV